MPSTWRLLLKDNSLELPKDALEALGAGPIFLVQDEHGLALMNADQRAQALFEQTLQEDPEILDELAR